MATSVQREWCQGIRKHYRKLAQDQVFLQYLFLAMSETKYEIECFYFYAKMETEVERIKGIHHTKETVFVLNFKPNRNSSPPRLLWGCNLSPLLTWRLAAGSRQRQIGPGSLLPKSVSFPPTPALVVNYYTTWQQEYYWLWSRELNFAINLTDC